MGDVATIQKTDSFSRAVFTDLDGTLLDGITFKQLVWWWLSDPPSARFRRNLLLRLAGYGIHAVTECSLVTLTCREYARQHEEHMSERLPGFLKQKILPLVRAEVAVRVTAGPAALRVLITGAPDFVAFPVARHLGIPDVAATVAAGVEGNLHSGSARLYGPHKRSLILSLCAGRGIPPSRAAYYTDDAWDEEILGHVGTPVVVRPRSSHLRRVARAKGWEVL